MRQKIGIIHQSIADAARVAGIAVQDIVAQVAAGERQAYGREDGRGPPERIPAEHFLVPVRAQEPRIRWYDEDGAEFPMCGADANGRPIYAIDPPTCIDVEESIVYVDGTVRWTDVVVGTLRWPWPSDAVFQAAATVRRALPPVPDPAVHEALMALWRAPPSPPRPEKIVRPPKRGPRSGKRERTARQMRADIAAGNMTRDGLAAMQEKALEATYGVSRDTARKARNDVLGEG
jgi:hypothetical protein